MRDDEDWNSADDSYKTGGWQRIVVLFLVILLVAPIVIGSLVVLAGALF